MNIKQSQNMTHIVHLREALVEKLIEFAADQHNAEIAIKCFTGFMRASEYCDDDILRVLDQSRDYFPDGPIRGQLIYEARAIRVNAGY